MRGFPRDPVLSEERKEEPFPLPLKSLQYVGCSFESLRISEFS